MVNTSRYNQNGSIREQLTFHLFSNFTVLTELGDFVSGGAAIAKFAPFVLRYRIPYTQRLLK